MRGNAINEIDALMSRLDMPLCENDLSNGWSLESQNAAKSYFRKLREALLSGSELPPLGIVRGLDHWGVTGGELLEDIAHITNKLR